MAVVETAATLAALKPATCVVVISETDVLLRPATCVAVKEAIPCAWDADMALICVAVSAAICADDIDPIWPVVRPCAWLVVSEATSVVVSASAWVFDRPEMSAAESDFIWVADRAPTLIASRWAESRPAICVELSAWVCVVVRAATAVVVRASSWVVDRTPICAALSAAVWVRPSFESPVVEVPEWPSSRPRRRQRR